MTTTEQNIQNNDHNLYNAFCKVINSRNSGEFFRLLQDNSEFIMNDKFLIWELCSCAVECGHVPALKKLIEMGANPDLLRGHCDCTLLHMSVLKGMQKILQILVDANANLDLQDIDGNTVLHLAAEKGDYDTFNYLQKAGADLTILNEDGDTALDILVVKVPKNDIEIIGGRARKIYDKIH
jgi:ankyrin repeat protein